MMEKIKSTETDDFKIGDKVTIKKDAIVLQNLKFHKWSYFEEELGTVFEICSDKNKNEVCLEAPGYGKDGNYGYGRIIVDVMFLTKI